VHLVASLRRSIDEARRKERAESANDVRRLLKRFGDPTAVVNVAAERSSGAGRTRQPRMPGSGARPPTPGPPRAAPPTSPPPTAAPAGSSPAPAAPTAATRVGRRGARPCQPQQPHAGTSARTRQPSPPTVTSAPGSAARPGAPPLPPITKLRAFDPDSVRFWAKRQTDSGTRLDLLSLFILAVASLLLPTIGFIGGAVMVHQTKAFKTEDELVAFAAIPVLGFVLMIALRWPSDPNFSETMTALADALAGATSIGGVAGAGYLWSRQGQRAAAEKAAARRAGQPSQPSQSTQATQRTQPRQPTQPGAAPKDGPRPSGRPGPSRLPGSGAPTSSSSPRQPSSSSALSQWFPPRRPR
jgi:hypothetical protein